MVYVHRSRASRYKCSKCKRVLTIDDATWRGGQDFVAAVQRAGWTLTPKVLCALDAATAEAYAKPDYRRAGYLDAMRGSDR